MILVIKSIQSSQIDTINSSIMIKIFIKIIEVKEMIITDLTEEVITVVVITKEEIEEKVTITIRRIRIIMVIKIIIIHRVLYSCNHSIKFTCLISLYLMFYLLICKWCHLICNSLACQEEICITQIMYRVIKMGEIWLGIIIKINKMEIILNDLSFYIV